jgi:predicted PurR-regulated permease PerM
MIEAFLNIPFIHKLIDRISNQLPLEMSEIAGTLRDVSVSIWSRLAEFFGGILAHLPGMTIALGVVVVSVYFFLVDGSKLVAFFRKNTIFTHRETDLLIRTLGEMCRSVILASVVSGLVQSVCEVITCMITSTPNVALIGLFVFVGSFIPVVGSAPITFGVAIHQLIEGHQVGGIVLFVMSVLLIGIDNTVRPWFLKGTVNLHPLLAFVAAFGGLQTLGFAGVFLGPILASLFVATLKVLISNT